MQVHARYITILIGANDACAWPMTDVDTFRADIDQALQLLKQELPNPRLLMVSIPDLYRLWATTHDTLGATILWRANQCPSLMTNFRSTAPADAARRHRVARRVNAYNHELAAACRRYGNHCRWDGGKVHEARLTRDMLGWDFFHPNLRGQQELAQVTAAGRGVW